MFEHVSRPEYAYYGGILAPPLARSLTFCSLAVEEDCSSEEQDDKQDVIEDESSSISESVVEPRRRLSFHHQYLLDEQQQGPQDKEGQFLFHLQHKDPE
ncbi:hypothetical protein EVAR_25081_1 [Eumeta japonica]|uniref:Uncharacterized protein n=1 Tax=Eumeta variegata TaxID=151549 RepID=A0A4C1YXY7_EUMVA|nr:hypothetical protein EVAR_25081_1 [Eumeta japonica]